MTKPLLENTILLLDTNILQYLDDKRVSSSIVALLSDFANVESNTLAASDYATLELLDNTSADREAQLTAILNPLTRYSVETNVLTAAAQLHALYKEDGIENLKAYDPGDRILAGTAIILDAIIVTANGRDFPRPFFCEIYHENIPVGHDSRKVYFLKPDLELINSRFTNRKK